MWQDIVLTVDGIILTLSTMPIAINKKSKVPLWGSLPTAAGILPVLSVVYATLNLPFSSIIFGIEGLLWWIVVIWRRA